jgi:DNA-binding transcriptional MerR regulator
MKMSYSAVALEIDKDWVEMIKTAREMGITPEQVREFIETNKNS